MDQHTIPNCYLKAWCDPAPLPEKHTPFIWLMQRNDETGESRKKRAPHKCLKEPERFTIQQGDGSKIRSVEEGLGATEDAFVRLRPKIERREPLTAQEGFDLCSFATAMFARAKPQGDHFAELFRTVHRQVENLEKKHGSKPGLSLETQRDAENGPASTVGMFMATWPIMFLKMNMTILCTQADEGFITSDQPFVMIDPALSECPPAFRSPAPASPTIEMTLPLTPQRCLLLSRVFASGYLDVPQLILDDQNRNRRLSCSEYFVSYKGIVKPYWFASPSEAESRLI